MASTSSFEVPLAGELIPTYRIDLSLPPSDRYTRLATDFAWKIQEITPLFDEVLSIAIPWANLRRFVQWLAAFALRRVYSSEETQELKGIAKASGVDLYFLVALNVLLDSLMGCTSGGVLTQPDNKKVATNLEEEDGTPRMMHFRTLDWGMNQLRDILVELEFVKSKSKTPEKVIARTITYAGFVGVLTGVRPNLSLSLNFRPNHNCSTIKLRIHQILVLFGFRPSIVSILRNNFLPKDDALLPLDQLATNLAESRSAPCYLILSSGNNTTVIEKDHLDGIIRSASDFIVHTNHDITPSDPTDKTHAQVEKSAYLGMEIFLDESKERRDCIQKKWDSLVKRQEKKRREKGEGPGDVGVNAVREKTLLNWVNAYPTTNETTHFACIMDPKSGSIRWIERGEDNAP